jgi:hypothetical protein
MRRLFLSRNIEGATDAGRAVNRTASGSIVRQSQVGAAGRQAWDSMKEHLDLGVRAQAVVDDAMSLAHHGPTAQRAWGAMRDELDLGTAVSTVVGRAMAAASHETAAAAAAAAAGNGGAEVCETDRPAVAAC